MVRAEIPERRTPYRRPDKAPLDFADDVDPPPVRRGAASRCLDWIITRALVFSVLVLAKIGESRALRDKRKNDERDSRGSD